MALICLSATSHHSTGGCASVVLRLVAILDGGGEAVCSSAASRGEYSVSSGGIWIDVKETKADALRRLEKGGGGFSVRCGVTVQSMERE